MGVDYSMVTEVTGNRVSSVQVERLVNRYVFAAGFCDGRDVLEVACGTGQGLGLLATRARSVVGGDYTEKLVARAAEHYRGRLPLLRLDAHALPFADGSFDVVILYEAIYYLADADRFVQECRRLLRPNGVVVVGTVNREWSDFNPSPFTHKYYSAAELRALLARHSFDVEVCGAFPAQPDSLMGWVLSVVKRAAVALHLIPKTMKGKELLKRLVYGKLEELGPEVDEGMAAYVEPDPVDAQGSATTHTILYAVGRLRAN